MVGKELEDASVEVVVCDGRSHVVVLATVSMCLWDGVRLVLTPATQAFSMISMVTGRTRLDSC